MSVKVGTNLLSLNVQRSLSRATDAVSTISERLSSGQRINKASDDAAGLAISSSLKADTRIYGQAIRNLNDGISAISIAGGAIGELKGVLLRIKEITTQAMNGTFSDTQRGSMQQEVSALQNEWNRILGATKFNGQNILTGAASRTILQGG